MELITKINISFIIAIFTFAGSSAQTISLSDEWEFSGRKGNTPSTTTHLLNADIGTGTEC